MIEKHLEERCLKILSCHPPFSQIVKAVEEMAELTKVLCKDHFTRAGRHEPVIIEEIADCIIMLVQMRELFGKEQIDNVIDFKLTRTLDRIREEERMERERFHIV